MKTLYILRGLPGSGKSTLAKTLGNVHFEADMYFIENGEYKFDPSKLKLAHNWCAIQTQKAMVEEEPKVVVCSLIVENRHGGINEHGVPEEKLELMKNRFDVKL